MTPPAVPAAAPVTLTPLLGMPEVHAGDDLADVVVRALAAHGIRLADGDVLVVSSKIASKALGLSATAQDRTEAVLRQSRARRGRARRPRSGSPASSRRSPAR